MATDHDKVPAMREGGRILGRIRRELMGLLRPDLDLMEVEETARKKISEAGATASFVSVKNYGFATCLMVNDEVVHIKPRHYELKKGDLVTIDVGLTWKRWQLDTSDSIIVGRENDRFISTGRQALRRAIAMATPGRRIGDISRTIQDVVERHGYSVVRQYCGHGIGREIHEEPQIFCYLDRPAGQTPLMTEGMTLAVEVMMNEGESGVVNDPSGWGARTKDGSRSAQFEHTILVTKDAPEVFTR